MATPLFVKTPLRVAIIDESAPNTNNVINYTGSDPIDAMYDPEKGHFKKMLIKFEDLTESQKGYCLDYLAIFASVSLDSAIDYPCVRISPLAEPFDPETVTWNTRPSKQAWGSTSVTLRNASGKEKSGTVKIEDTQSNWGRINQILTYGIELYYENIFYSDAHGVVSVTAPTYYQVPTFSIGGLTPAEGAYVPKLASSTFSWAIQTDALEDNPPSEHRPKQTSAVFKWRNSSNGAVQSISVGASLSVVVPAGTFSTDAIQWCVTSTLSNGDVLTTDWVTVSTVDATSSTDLLSPVNSTLDGAADNAFLWEHIIPTGTAQTAFDLQTSSNGTTWTTLLSGTTADTSAVIPANTLTGGDLYWRVRTYNTDGVAGEWSEPAHCIVVAAPAAPLVSIVDSAPRFAIRWQQAGQQGFEIMLDGKLIAKRFGGTSSYQYDGYLDSGSHVVQVRIQNQYGLWSAWGAASLTIANVSGAEIALSAEADNTVTLQWSTADAYHAYLIYRDGLLIGQTPNTSFKDNFALGDVSYQVRGIYDDTGYYTLSNVAAVSVRVSALMISPIKSPSWQRIPLSTSSLRSRTHSATQAVSYLHYTGLALPSAEIGEALDKTYRFDAAFLRANRAAAEAFESLIGQLVCIKDPDGYRVIGVLGTYSMTATPFYKSYSCTVTLVNWWEGADL